ncbi:Protein SHQ1 homolog [Caenorhabditis elegans]|uniref:Protein SHQ1 homolog n=2 Tax=Caenorhabditis elegans TaxID=6239 RepID=SHQ1_CAEEL|nr:Protein SHQ1 homolog [Caenorhabditis elegans]Q9TYM6.4 RecName: Full=Protein SHQ1 homolog [Caenorhabditis elegans]CCD71630.1 Protein SHQ1 homolog [Caenorhabditis elegans]|eukprot:NP_500150.2 Protein SHQ1 homolog [Caenorhabditis elegans]
MLTPVFWITQDDDALLIRIRAPHGNIAELDYDHGDYMFVFTCPPYFLRLHFKQMVEEYGSGNGSVEWKSDEGEFHIKVPKMHKKEHFSNLDMITELLTPSTTHHQPHGNQLVEEMDDSEDDDEGDGSEFLVEQQPAAEPEEPKSDGKIEKFGYGFGWSKFGVIERLRDEIGKIVDILEPENVEIEKRADKLMEFDWENFDEGRYLADTLEPEEELLAVISSKFAQKLEISDEDRTKLKDLKKSKTSAKINGNDVEIMTSLIDIVFGYCYDQRVNDWESACESGWNCAKLSPSLSFFAKFSSVKECLLACTRRALTYPLYRSFQLTQRVIQDVCHVITAGGGRPALLHILCDLHRIFIESGEFRYILNDLMIADYIFWIQTVPDEILTRIQTDLTEISGKIDKYDIGWDLEVLEAEAKLANTQLDSDDEPDN